jgi:hypothetical protein
MVRVAPKIADNVWWLGEVALSKNLKLTTALDRAITQNPCYVPLNLQNDVKTKNSSRVD